MLTTIDIFLLAVKVFLSTIKIYLYAKKNTY